MSPQVDDTGEIRIVNAPAPLASTTGQLPTLRVASRRRFTIWSVLALFVAAVISFVAVGQLRGPDRFRQQLDAESEGDLARILSSLSSESSALQDELSSLKLDLNNLQNSSEQQGAVAAETDQQLNALRVLAGTVSVSGPGISVNIKDPQNQVTFDALVDAVQELRDAGAEALACNGRRVGVMSSFTQQDGHISLDGVALSAPYELTAIGPASTMEGGLKIPGGSLDTLRAFNGATVDVTRNDDLTLEALTQTPSFDAARPVGSGS